MVLHNQQLTSFPETNDLIELSVFNNQMAVIPEELWELKGKPQSCYAL